MATKKLSAVCAGTFDNFMKTANLSAKLKDDKFLAAIADTKAVKSKWDSFMGVLSEVYLNGLLSSLGTPLINLVSGFTQGLLMPAIRLVEAIPTRNSALAREAMAMYAGSIKGFAEFIPFFKEGWAKGLPLDLDISDPRNLGMTKAEYKKFLKGMGLTPDSDPERIREAMGQAYDYVRKSIPSELGGGVVRAPSRLLIAIDEGMRAVFRRQSFHKQAMQKALMDSKRGKGNTNDIYKALTKDAVLYGDKAEEAWKRLNSSDDGALTSLGSLIEAQDYAKLATFQQDLIGTARGLQKVREDFKPLILFLPFFKTPYNILKEGLTFIPGLGYVTARAKPFGYKKVQTVVERVIDEDGVETVRYRKVPVNMSSSEAVSRQMLGFGMMATAMTLMDQGLITGGYPDNPSERETMKAAGIPEFSIKVGDTWVSYRKIEPISTVMGLVSDLSKLGDAMLDPSPKSSAEDSALEKEISLVMWSLKQNIFGKSFMEGLANAVNLISLNEVTAGGALNQTAASIGKGLVPFSALVNSVAVSMDTAGDGKAYDRQARTISQKLKQRIPGLRETLPLMYGVFGEERKLNIMDIWTGIKTVDDTDRTALQEEIGVLGVAFGQVDNTIVQQLRITNEELAKLRMYSAGFANMFLEPLLEDQELMAMPDTYKEQIFRTQMSRARRAAMNKYVAERMIDPAFQERFIKAYQENKGLQDLLATDEF